MVSQERGVRKGLARHIISLVFVFSVGGYAYYEYLQTKKSKNTKSEERNFFTKKLDNLSEIKITKAARLIVLSKKNQEWILKKPIKDSASFSEVSRWFDEIRNQKVREITIEGEIPWKDYYLKKYPEVLLKFSDDSQPIVFSVSSKSSFDGKYFIRKDDKLFIGEKYFFNEVNSKNFDSFRNKKIIPSYGGHPIKVVIKNKQTLSFDWIDYNWFFKEKNFPLDTKRLESFWSDLASIDVLSVKKRATADSLKKYKLNQATYQIQLSYAGEKKTTLKISSVRNNRAYVYGSHRDYILEISKEDAEKIKLSKHDIRDHGRAFNFQKEKASSLELKSKKVSYSLLNKNEKWVSLSSPEKKLDSDKVQILLNSIHELRGQRYKKGSLKKVVTSIIIKDPSGGVLLDLKAAPSSSSIVWVKTNFSKELIAISKSSLDLIFKKDISN